MLTQKLLGVSPGTLNYILDSFFSRNRSNNISTVRRASIECALRCISGSSLDDGIYIYIYLTADLERKKNLTFREGETAKSQEGCMQTFL